MTTPRCRDIAHVSGAELRTAVPAQTAEFLVGQLTAQIVLDDGTPPAIWYHVSGMSYELVYTIETFDTHGTPAVHQP